MRKDAAFEFKEEHRKATRALKGALVKAPVLARPDFSKIFTVQCDASNESLGAILTQNDDDGFEHPIMFISRPLTNAERKYSTTERECLAMVWSIKKFRPYIEGSHFRIITNHHSLKWLMTIKDP